LDQCAAGGEGVVMDCCAVIWVVWVEVLDLVWRLGGERGEVSEAV